MANSDLMDYFKFDDSDLAANRLGSLSARQRAVLDKDSGWIKRWSGITGGAFLLLALALLAWGTRDVLVAQSPDLSYWVWVAVAGFLAYWFLRRWRSTIYDMSIKKIEGPIAIRSSRTSQGGAISYELHVGSEEFEDFYVDEVLKDCMSNGDIYDVYYVRNSSGMNFIQSVELVSKKDA